MHSLLMRANNKLEANSLIAAVLLTKMSGKLCPTCFIPGCLQAPTGSQSHWSESATNTKIFLSQLLPGGHESL